jgi:hypothetical protein
MLVWRQTLEKKLMISLCYLIVAKDETVVGGGIDKLVGIISYPNLDEFHLENFVCTYYHSLAILEEEEGVLCLTRSLMIVFVYVMARYDYQE